jgi:hypothetical protein
LVSAAFPRAAWDDAISSPRMAEQTPSDEEFPPLTQDEQEVIVQVVRLLRKVRFGTVLLVVQDGKVVQIEMAEKIRLR